MELVIMPHKSIAELGVIGRADDMHRIMDVERDATLKFLDALTRREGGRRGRGRVPAPTSGLVYAHTRHGTSRAGDPCPHDHVLVANVVEMRDAKGGFKAADTAQLRHELQAATRYAQEISARKAEELGYAVDRAKDGSLRHWSIRGVPDKVVRVHSKRSAQIAAQAPQSGDWSYQSRSVAARQTRARKGTETPDELMPRWHKELESIGWGPERLAGSIDQAAKKERERVRLSELQGARGRVEDGGEVRGWRPPARQERQPSPPVDSSPSRGRYRVPAGF
jgi:conjugative relaxase-like TrwC/TraI family protein